MSGAGRVQRARRLTSRHPKTTSIQHSLCKQYHQCCQHQNSVPSTATPHAGREGWAAAGRGTADDQPCSVVISCLNKVQREMIMGVCLLWIHQTTDTTRERSTKMVRETGRLLVSRQRPDPQQGQFPCCSPQLPGPLVHSRRYNCTVVRGPKAWGGAAGTAHGPWLVNLALPLPPSWPRPGRPRHPAALPGNLPPNVAMQAPTEQPLGVPRPLEPEQVAPEQPTKQESELELELEKQGALAGSAGQGQEADGEAEQQQAASAAAAALAALGGESAPAPICAHCGALCNSVRSYFHPDTREAERCATGRAPRASRCRSRCAAAAGQGGARLRPQLLRLPVLCPLVSRRTAVQRLPLLPGSERRAAGCGPPPKNPGRRRGGAIRSGLQRRRRQRGRGGGGGRRGGGGGAGAQGAAGGCALAAPLPGVRRRLPPWHQVSARAGPAGICTCLWSFKNYSLKGATCQTGPSQHVRSRPWVLCRFARRSSLCPTCPPRPLPCPVHQLAPPPRHQSRCARVCSRRPCNADEVGSFVPHLQVPASQSCSPVQRCLPAGLPLPPSLPPCVSRLLQSGSASLGEPWCCCGLPCIGAAANCKATVLQHCGIAGSPALCQACSAGPASLPSHHWCCASSWQALSREAPPPSCPSTCPLLQLQPRAQPAEKGAPPGRHLRARRAAAAGGAGGEGGDGDGGSGGRTGV